MSGGGLEGWILGACLARLGFLCGFLGGPCGLNGMLGPWEALRDGCQVLGWLRRRLEGFRVTFARGCDFEEALNGAWRHIRKRVFVWHNS